jgi:PAS domain S-box-containing protein
MADELRVLLIEDNEDDAVLLLRELKRLGYQIFSQRCSDAACVNRALTDGVWDIVISDYSMNGFTAADALTIMQRKNLDLPFIITSGEIGEETAVEAMRAGAHDFLLKGKLTRLGAVIERELREAEIRRRRQQTEEELRQSEDRFSRAFAASSIPIVIFALDDERILDANERFYDFFDFRPKDVIKANFGSLPVWDNPADFTLITQWLREGRTIQDRETCFYRHGGRRCYALVSTERIEIGGQSCVLTMLYDITERKLAEDRLRRLQTVTAGLSEALTPERVAEVVIDQAADALGATAAMVVSVVEESGTLEIVNQTGYEPALIDLWQSLPPGENSPLAMAIHQMRPLWVESVNAPGVTQSASMWMHDDIYNGWVAVPMIVDGKAIGGIGMSFRQPQRFDNETMQFISAMADQCGQAMQRARLYLVEQQARLAAEEADQLKIQFLAMISHELRTPLASIKGYISTLLADDITWSTDDQTEFIQTIDEETDRLTDLVNQLLDMSRLQAGQMSIDPTPRSLRDVLQHSLAQVRTITRKHTICLQIPPELPLILADENRVNQIIANLIENSVRYSEPNTTIYVNATCEERWVRIDVRDEGFGISDEDAHRVFEPFRQINRKKGFRQGTGLGLTICKGLVEAHGGTIWIQGQKNAGTTVSFTLPVA